VDRVTEVTLGWLGEVRRFVEHEHGAEEISFGQDTQSWLTNVVVRGFEAAVHDVVAPGSAEIVLETVMRETPDDADVQVTPSAEAQVIPGADLPQAVVEYLAPQFGTLAGQGLHVNTTLLTTALSDRIAAAVETDFQIGESRLPLQMLLGGLPGFPFPHPRPRPNGDVDGDDDDDDDRAEGGQPTASAGS
jgi:hypothetical protein